jgi:hypothetical protein
MFSVNSAGDVFLRQPLDYEQEDFYSFLVHVTDGRTVSLSIICEDKNLSPWNRTKCLLVAPILCQTYPIHGRPATSPKIWKGKKTKADNKNRSPRQT